jgi:ubiquinone/menaquinone biosynthesis C-methylase UbiE
MSDQNIKKNVREFYDRVGWQTGDGDIYQNAEYEDLRPVSQEYIHRCHMRIKRHLSSTGGFLLDAGSGPVQYPEYQTYSEGYQARVCVDISIVAMREARKRLDGQGRYVVADIAHLPFRSDIFDGIVSLHTIHHVPMEDKLLAYEELFRTLRPGKSMTIVNGWTNAPLMVRLRKFMQSMRRLHAWWLRKVKKQDQKKVAPDPIEVESASTVEGEKVRPEKTFVQKLNAKWLIQNLKGKMPFDILVWRSVNVAFLRSVIYPEWGGKFWLKLIYGLEELFPRWLGRIGQYPLVVISKPWNEDQADTI